MIWKLTILYYLTLDEYKLDVQGVYLFLGYSKSDEELLQGQTGRSARESVQLLQKEILPNRPNRVKQIIVYFPK